MANIKVGIVEDELIIAKGISKSLEELGYTPVGPAINYTSALEMIERERPDILLLDIILSGNKDGIDLAWKIKEDYNIPFIFLTANSDAETVDRAKKVCPPAYLIKPFNKDELYTSIEICLHNFSATQLTKPAEKGNYIINDCLFIKQTHNYVKVRVDDIIYLESDRVYVVLHTVVGNYLVRNTLQNYLELVGSRNFVRVHRSYAINVLHLSSINTEGVCVSGQTVPIGKAYREELLSVIKLG
jgi:DNA-binding LytR/AlgR family response regulator